jgi:hypothetical protein
MQLFLAFRNLRTSKYVTLEDQNVFITELSCLEVIGISSFSIHLISLIFFRYLMPHVAFHHIRTKYICDDIHHFMSTYILSFTRNVCHL